MTAVEVGPAEWQPGDPLYREQDHPHSRYLFNFRTDSEAEECRCSDAASWPNPGGRKLPEGDELADLIAWHRARRLEGDPS